MPQTGDAALPTTAHPLTDRTLRHAQRRSDVALPPALLFQFPGAQPPPLAPVRTHRSSPRHAPSPAFLAPALALCPESFNDIIGPPLFDALVRLLRRRASGDIGPDGRLKDAAVLAAARAHGASRSGQGLDATAI